MLGQLFAFLSVLSFRSESVAVLFWNKPLQHILLLLWCVSVDILSDSDINIVLIYYFNVLNMFLILY